MLTTLGVVHAIIGLLVGAVFVMCSIMEVLVVGRLVGGELS
jgi:hypothetical protein